MAILTASQRLTARDRFLQYFSRSTDPNVRKAFILNKAEADQVIAAADDFQEANKAAFNTTIPVGPRAKLISKDKAKAFNIVSTMKWETE